jgi:hypothetical protein
MRNLSFKAIQSLQETATAEVWLMLLTISHPSLSTPIYLVNNTVDIVSRGTTYIGLPFDIDLPNEDQDAPGAATLSVDNVSRVIVDAVRAMDVPATITLEVILASDPDTVEIAFYDMVLRNVTYDATTIKGSLQWEDILVEPIALQMTPARFPGMF